jgi:hypothetical protein
VPSYGASDAPVTLIVACSPASSHCRTPLHAATLIADGNPERVRVVWVPLFDLAVDNAADLGVLGDAALCAERVGTASDADFDRPGSPGWRWVEAMIDDASGRRRRTTTDEQIDGVAARLRVPARAFALCRAELAGATLAHVAAVRKAGVAIAPATLVGGRIYGPITDHATLQQLVDAEVAPGDCDVDHGCLHLGDYAPTWRRGL